MVNYRFIIINENFLYLMQEDIKQYCFTKDITLAMKFLDEGNARLMIRKLPHLKGLSVRKFKI